jgi:hypothetical protein
MLAWQVLYEGYGLVVGGRPHEFSIFGFVMAKDLGDLDRQVTPNSHATSNDRAA